VPKIDTLFKLKKISRINEFELDRYINFFTVCYNDDLGNCEFVLEKHPRWSIISGYYAMHDITKLLFAKNYRIRVNKQETHATTIDVLAILLTEKDIIKLFQKGYEYSQMASELYLAREERSKVQYYTGSPYAQEYYAKKSIEFHNDVVIPYINKMLTLIGD